MQSQSHEVLANVVTSRGSVERKGCGRDGVTHTQCGVTASDEKMSRVALLNDNTTKVNSSTRGSGPTMRKQRQILVALVILEDPSSEVR